MKGDPSALLARKLSLHTPLSEAERAALGQLLARLQPLRNGETLAAKGDPLDIATLVVEGMLCRAKMLSDGRRQILSLLLPGDLVDAHASLLRRRDDSLEAVGATVVMVVPQSRLAALEQTHPNLRDAFLREAFIETAIAREWVLNVGRRNAREALAHLLCELHTRFEAVGLATADEFRFPLKQQHLADALGLSNIHLNRVLRQLRDERLIVLGRRWVTVPDRPALCAAAHFEGDYLHLPTDRAA